MAAASTKTTSSQNNTSLTSQTDLKILVSSQENNPGLDCIISVFTPQTLSSAQSYP